MGLFSHVIAPAIGATYAPWDDFWFQKDPRGSSTSSGYPVSPDSSMRLGAVYGSVGLISDMVSSLPLILYERRDDDGKDRATTHPLYDLLRSRPNAWQTAREWRKMGTEHLLLRGNFYNHVVLDGRFAVAEIIPLNPDRMKVTQLDSGRRGYLYRPDAGQPIAYTQDEIFHVMGRSRDGVTGCSVIEDARETIGSAQSQEQHAGSFWRNGSQVSGVLQVPGALNAASRKANEDAWAQAHAGSRNAGKTALLEGGVTFTPISMSARDAEFIASRNFSVEDIARFFQVMPYWLGVEGQWATGTGIEQLMIQLVKVTLMPWFVTWEQAIFRDLIDDETYFAEFLVDALMRGDTAARYQSYAIAIMNGIMSENEVRIKENLNPFPGLDEPRRSVNQDRGGNPTQSPQNGPPARRTPTPPPDDPNQDEARARTIVREAAARTVRKEIAAVVKWAPRYAADREAWRAWVVEFYEKHEAVLIEALCLTPEVARRYAAAHSAALLEFGMAVIEAWEHDEPPKLAALALGEREALAMPAPRLEESIVDKEVTHDAKGRVTNIREIHRRPLSAVPAPPTQPSQPIHVTTPVTFNEGAFVIHTAPVHVSVEPPPPAEVTINAPITVEPAAMTIADGAIRVRVRTPDVHVENPVTIADGAVQVSVAPAKVEVNTPPVSIAEGAVQVAIDAPVSVTTPPVTIAEGAVQVSSPVTVEAPAIHVDAPDIHVETPAVTIAEGAVQVQVDPPDINVATPDVNVVTPPITINMPDPPAETTVEKDVKHDKDGRITKIRETHTRKK